MGYIYADAYINKKAYRINGELSSKDRERVEIFAEFIGFDLKYVHDRKRILFKYGVQLFFNVSFVYPICKPMVLDLCNLEYCEKKAIRKDLPKFICDLIDKAKIKDRKNWFFTPKGKSATMWLFGFYDGDGSYDDFHTARLDSASETLLRQIKDCFYIPNEVIIKQSPDTEIFIYDYKTLSSGYYRLNLGGILFKAMLQNYKNTLKRKRPPNE